MVRMSLAPTRRSGRAKRARSTNNRTSRVDPDASAYPHRSARFGIGFPAGWDEPGDDQAAIEWAQRLNSATSGSSVGVDTNYLDRDDDRVGAAHRGNLEQLQRVKAAYDPDEVVTAHGHAPSTNGPVA
jgi:hypothetical protein